jgi:hypothetical protein
VPEEESKPKAKANPKAASPATGEGDATAVPPAKKEKAPALEDKPFTEFIESDFIPALQKALQGSGAADLSLKLTRSKVSTMGYESPGECAQVIGIWNNGQRQFTIYFFDDSIQGQRGISCVDRQSKPSTIESFLIDERKITLDLLVFGVMRRLNGQKWLLRN